MTAKSKMKILNRALGYEVAVLLMNRPMNRSELRNLLPYDTIHDTQIDRIIDVFWEENLVDVVGTRGTDKFTFDTDHFTASELNKINERALARMRAPVKSRGEPVELDKIPGEFFIHCGRETTNGRPSHTDVPNFPSFFP